MRATCRFRVVTRRTFFVVRRPGSSTRPACPIPSPARSRLSARASSSWPTTPARSTGPPSARTLCATLAEPPTRRCSLANRTIGTGASGEMRSTWPTMNWSTITSPTTRTGERAKRATSSRARAGGTWSGNVGPFGGEGQGDEQQEQHEELGVTEVVFEHPGGQHTDGRGEPGGREVGLGRRPQAPRQVAEEQDDEPQPGAERRQAAFGGDLERHVVQVRVDRLGVRLA